MRALVPVLVAIALARSAAYSIETDAERYWPQWRGPHATGASSHAKPPTEWSETKNIRWKIEVLGRGSASPVIWGDRIFLLTAIPAGVPPGDSHNPRGGIELAARRSGIVLELETDRVGIDILSGRIARQPAGGPRAL